MAYNAEDYYHVLLWMGEALERIKKENPPTAAEADILEYYAFALYKQDNLKRALLSTDRLYEIHPNHARAKGNIKWYEDQLATEGVKKSEYRSKIPPLINIRPVDNFESTERSVYEALCRNEIPVVSVHISAIENLLFLFLFRALRKHQNFIVITKWIVPISDLLHLKLKF